MKIRKVAQNDGPFCLAAVPETPQDLYLAARLQQPTPWKCQVRPQDWPLLTWEMDGFSLEEVKARAKRLADERGPVIIEGQP